MKRNITRCKKNQKARSRSSSSFVDDLFGSEPDLFTVSEKITNNTKSFAQTQRQGQDQNHTSQPLYLSQFDTQTFDSTGLPSAPNDIYETNDKAKLANLERNLSFNGGWSQYDQGGSMSYGLVPDSKLSHNNMTPHFSMKNGYGSNDLYNDGVIDYKTELFTGSRGPTHQKKTESKPLFGPETGFANIYGNPVMATEDRQRFTASRYRQGETPFTKIQVTPGLGLKYNEVGTHGQHSMYRALDKPLEELRVNPKTTYEGRIIEGQRGQNRPNQAPVISYRPETFKEQSPDDLLPTSSTTSAPKIRDNFIMKSTDRADQHFEYTGGAYNTFDTVGQNVPEHMRSLIKHSEKASFTLPTPLQKFSKEQTLHNPNVQSYDISTTLKDLTVDNNYIAQATGTTTYANTTDVAKPTIKETTVLNTLGQTNVAPNTMRECVYFSDIAKPTIAETTTINTQAPRFSGLNTGNQQRVYHSDAAKTTNRETTDKPVEPSNVFNTSTTYSNLLDSAKSTISETTTAIPYQTVVTPINQQQGYQYQDSARTTMAEQTVSIPRQMIITPANQQQGYQYQDQARTTMAEQTVSIPRQTIITPVNQQQGYQYQDSARTTMAEQTVAIPRQTIITPVNQQQGYQYQDYAKTTIGEQTVSIPRQTNISVNVQQGPAQYQDQAKTTLSEQTIHLPRNTNVGTSTKAHTPHYQDQAKTTMAEQTVGINRQTNITPLTYQGPVQYQDQAKTTLSESTIHLPRSTNLGTNNQGHTLQYQDSAKTTLSESTIHLPRNTNLGLANQGHTLHHQDQAKTTLSESTIHLPRNTNLGINNQGHTLQHQDQAKTTLSESTVQTPWSTFVSSYNKAPTLHYQDQAKTTMSEQTVSIPRQTVITAVNQHAPTPHYQDQAKTTMSEQTVSIPRQTIVTAINQHAPTPHYQDQAKVTLKEQTVTIPYQTVITAVNQHAPTPHHQDIAKTTLKEQTIAIPYNTTITAVNQTQGSAHTFDRTPLKTTLKEQTVVIPYQTVVSSQVQGSTPHHQDQAKTTLSEQTVSIPRHTQITAPNKASTVHHQDQAKTTLKEQTVDIPRNTIVTAVNQQQGKSSTFDSTPLPTTLKEQLIDNNYIGMPSLDVNAKGYGYVTDASFAPNTNRQFTGQEVYITPVKGQNRERLYDDAYNARVDDRKDLLHWYYEPVTRGPDIGPQVEDINMRTRDDTSASRIGTVAYTFNSSLDRMKPQTSTRCSQTTDSNRFIDPVLIAQLKSNPLNISVTNEYSC